MMDHTSLKDDQNKLNELAKAWSRMVGCISHELTSQLAIMRMVGYTLDQILATIFTGYTLAAQHNLIDAPAEEQDRIQDIAEHLRQSIPQHINAMQEFLNLLHPYNKQLLSTAEETTQLSVKNVVEAVIEKYSFAHQQERALITTDFPCDFIFNFSPIFIDNLLDNLLRNALRAIRKEQKGQIHIWTEEENDHYILHFKDSASGMDQNQLAHLFERFFSKRENNVVPGLGFCRLALLQRGGDILCHSVTGEYNDFRIKIKK